MDQATHHSEAGRPDHSPITEIVAVIPARGGSKGLPRKNILPMAGKPLLAYSIDVALSARNIDRVIVSTEDEEIAAIAKEHGAEVPFLRPKSMAEDKANLHHAIEHCMTRLYGKFRGDVGTVTMYPTSPFRSKALVEFLVDKVLGGYRRVRTLRPLPGARLYSKNGKGLRPIVLDDDLPGRYFRPYGIINIDRWSRYSTSVYSYVITDKVMVVDIDTLEDFYLAESIVQNSMFDFENGGMDGIGQVDAECRDLH